MPPAKFVSTHQGDHHVPDGDDDEGDHDVDNKIDDDQEDGLSYVINKAHCHLHYLRRYEKEHGDKNKNTDKGK